MNSVLSYWFFAYRSSLLQADQKAYVTSNYQSVFNLVKAIVQIAVLVVFHNFTVYLVTQMLCTIGLNITIALRVKKDYPVFGSEKVPDLPKDEKKRIFKDVKALMLQKVSFKILNTSDSLIISAFVGVSWVGLISNYLLIVESIVAVLSQVFSAISASLGNYFAKEDKESGYQLFLKIDFLNFWLYGFSSIALLSLLSPFIFVWIGDEYLLPNIVVVAIVCRFFVEGYMNMMSTFRSTLGLFVQGKYFPLLVACINIILSISLSYSMGIAGVIFATPISRCFINVWYMPLVIHRNGFGKNVIPYYVRIIKRVFMLVSISIIMLVLSTLIFKNGVTIVRFIIMTILTGIIPNLILAIIFFKTKEFDYFYKLVRNRIINV